MELILLTDVENLGFKDDIVTVKNGYGRNYLIPQKTAVMATSSAKKVLEETLRQRKKKEEKNIEEAKVKAEAIKNIDIKVSARAGGDGKLFGSVTNADISDVLSKDGHMIDKKFIKIAGGGVKRAGKYTVTLRFHREVIIETSIEVLPVSATKKK